MHVLRHRYTYSPVNSCPALRNKKPYLQYVFPRVAKCIYLVTYIAMVFERLLFSCHPRMHVLRHRYTYSPVNSCPALRNKKPYLQYVFPRVAKRIHLVTHIAMVFERLLFSCHPRMHVLRHRYTYSPVNSCPALRNKKPYLQYVFPRVAKRIHLVTHIAMVFVSRQDCECLPIE